MLIKQSEKLRFNMNQGRKVNSAAGNNPGSKPMELGNLRIEKVHDWEQSAAKCLSLSSI
jgi:hypothetical protein